MWRRENHSVLCNLLDLCLHFAFFYPMRYSNSMNFVTHFIQITYAFQHNQNWFQFWSQPFFSTVHYYVCEMAPISIDILDDVFIFTWLDRHDTIAWLFEGVELFEVYRKEKKVSFYMIASIEWMWMKKEQIKNCNIKTKLKIELRRILTTFNTLCLWPQLI